MIVTCEVIRDLLPLYAEGLASGSSKKLVEEHLAQCEDCRGALEELKKPPLVPAEEPAMGNVRREIAKRRWLAVGCAVLLLCAIGCGLLNWLTRPIYLDESVITAVTPNGDGTVTISMDAAAAGRKTFQLEVEPSAAGETLVIWTSRWLEMTWSEPIPRPLAITRTVIHNGVYLFTGREGEEDLLLYENPEKYVNGGVMTLPRLVLSYYFLLALAAGGVVLIAAALLRKHRAGKVLAALGALLWSYALCQGIVCGFTFSSFYAAQEFCWALVMAVFLWGAAMLGWWLRRRN